MKFSTISLLVCIFSCFIITDGVAQLTVSNSMTPAQLVQNVLLGTGVTATNVTYTGSSLARGTFNGTNSNIGLSSGVLLTTGSIQNAAGPNTQGGAGTDNMLNGNAELDALAGIVTHDAAVLSFDFVPLTDTIRFRYVFGSEEYNEFVCSTFNDVFAFFISGPGITGQQNIALIPGTTVPVTINRVNNGSCGGIYTFHGGCDLSNSGYFVDNNNPPGATVQYDGFTTVFTAQAIVTPCVTYHIRLEIADAGDGALDSGVFLEAGSFVSGTTVAATAQSTSGISIPTGIIGCAPFTATFTNTSTGTNQFTWDFGDGSPTDTSTNPSHTFMQGGTYLIQLIADDTTVCNFSDTAFFSLVVDSGHLVPSFNLTQIGTCDSIRVNLNSTSTGAHLYSWNFGDGTTAYGFGSSHNYFDTGTYTIYHLVTDTICHLIDSVSQQIRLLHKIKSTIYSSTNEGCTPLSLQMCDTDPSTTTHTKFLWNFGNGSTWNKDCGSVYYGRPGTYNARLEVTDSTTCNLKDTSTTTVHAKVNPEAFFDLPEVQNVLYPVLFTNASRNSLDYSWDFDDGQQSGLENPSHQYIQPGTYHVCLTVHKDACFDTVCHQMKVIENPQAVWFPAAFSPNGDGENDVYAPVGIGIVSSQMTVYDRWGEKLFETADAQRNGWDGTYNGKLAGNGVYVVHIVATLVNQEVVEKMVTLTIFR